MGLATKYKQSLLFVNTTVINFYNILEVLYYFIIITGLRYFIVFIFFALQNVKELKTYGIITQQESMFSSLMFQVSD